MKPILANLFLLLLVIATSCHRNIDAKNDPGDLQYTTDLNQAKQLFDGKWTMYAIRAMVANAPVRDVQLVVGAGQITVIQDGKQTDKVNVELVNVDLRQDPDNFWLKTNAVPRSDNWYVRDPTLRVSSNRLVLITGGSESITFSFKRVE